MKLAKMLEEIDSSFKLSNIVKSAMLKVPREYFVPDSMLHIAYKLDALPLGAEQFISSPLTVAKMTQYLEAEHASKILEIGLGSGYQAAVLSKISRGVFSIERISRLREEACARFRRLKIENIITRVDDGQNGWATHAPFDRILFSAGIKEIPQKIISQLNEGGILVAPMIDDGGKQVITRFIKKAGSLEILDIKEKCAFVLVKNGVEW